MARDVPLLRARSRAATSAWLALAWFGVPACGSSTSGAPSDTSGGSPTAGTAASGGSKSEGGTSVGVAGADAGAGTGAKSGGGSGGASSGGKSSGGASGNAGASGSGGASGRGCPASAPSLGAACPPPSSPLGLTCYYDDCVGSGVRKKATCSTAIPEIGNPTQLWAVETSACEPPDCVGNICSVGQACVILEGGARMGQCAPQSCGTGPIECDCVKGCYSGCFISTFGPFATFTCSTCSDPRGCP